MNELSVNAGGQPPVWKKVLRVLAVVLVWLAYLALAAVNGVSGFMANLFGDNAVGHFFGAFTIPGIVMNLLLSVPLAVTFGPPIKRFVMRKFAPRYSEMLESGVYDGFVPRELHGGFGTLQMGNKRGYFPLASVARSVEQRLPDFAAMRGAASALSRQLTRYEQRRDAAMSALSQKFQTGELTYAKYADGINRAEKQVYGNSAALIRSIWEFDENDYREIRRELDKIRVRETKDAAKSRIFENDVIAPFMDIANDVGAALTGRDIFKGKPSAASVNPANPANNNDEIVRKKTAQYDTVISEVNRGIENNEQFIIQLDALTAEIYKLGGSGDASSNSEALAELEKLTQQVKLYK